MTTVKMRKLSMPAQGHAIEKVADGWRACRCEVQAVGVIAVKMGMCHGAHSADT